MPPISRRDFMFGALLTDALTRPSIASLKALGYQSPNETSTSDPDGNTLNYD